MGLRCDRDVVLSRSVPTRVLVHCFMNKTKKHSRTVCQQRSSKQRHIVLPSSYCTTPQPIKRVSDRCYAWFWLFWDAMMFTEPVLSHPSLRRSLHCRLQVAANAADLQGEVRSEESSNGFPPWIKWSFLPPETSFHLLGGDEWRSRRFPARKNSEPKIPPCSGQFAGPWRRRKQDKSQELLQSSTIFN